MLTVATDVIVIGGGASGLMAAYAAAREGAGVMVLEKMPRPGRKIMITGKGRCNFTNVKPWDEFSRHIRSKANFVRPAFYNLDPEAVLSFMEEHGVDVTVERGDRAFPQSYKAAHIVDALVTAARREGADILTDTEVETIIKDPSGEGFLISCRGGRTYSCLKLIIATGGLSYPGTGSTGDGYRWAKSLGHSVVDCFPSLTALVPKGYKSKEECLSVGQIAAKVLDGGGRRFSVGPEMTNMALPGEGYGKTKMRPSGVADDEEYGMTREAGKGKGSLPEGYPEPKGHIDRALPLSDTGRELCGIHLKNVALTLWVGNDKVQTEIGELDFTDGGIEGPIGFALSRSAVKALVNGGKVALSLDLKPGIPDNELKDRILSLKEDIRKDPRSRNASKSALERVLLGKLLPRELVAPFLRANRGRDLAQALKDWRFEIEGYVGYERCVVTAGGVSTDEVLPKTMESRLCKGLYFCGEVLDIDSDTGGYNLQTAFSTGWLAGHSAAVSL